MTTSSSFTKDFIDTISGEIASDLTSSLKRKISTSGTARALKGKLGIDDLHPLTKDILIISINESLQIIKQSHKSIKAFCKDKSNKRIIAEWIKNPDSFSENKNELKFSYAKNQKEKSNIDEFVLILFNKIVELRNDKISPEQVQVIREIIAIKDNTEQLLKVTSETRDSTKFLDEKITKVLELVSQNTDVQNSNELTTSSEIIDEIESLIDEGRLDDARKRAQSELNKLKIGENSELECRLYRFIANTYLKAPYNQEKAILYLEKVIMTCSDIIVLERNKTLKYFLERNFEMAEEHANKLIQLDNSVNSVGLKANILWVKGQKNEAIKFLKNNSFNDDAEYHYYMSYAYLESGDQNKALLSAENAIKRDVGKKHYLELYIQIVINIYQSSIPQKESIWGSEKETKLLKQAIVYSSEIIANTNEQESERVFTALTNRGILSYWLGDNDQSVEDLVKAKNLNPGDNQLLRNLANIYATKGDYEEALETVDKLLEIIPDDIEIIRLKALTLLEKKEPEKAIEFLEKQLDLKNINLAKLELYRHLVSAYDTAHEALKADTLIEKLEKKFPENSTVALAKVDRLELFEKYNEAIEILENIKKVSERILLLVKYSTDALIFVIK